MLKVPEALGFTYVCSEAVLTPHRRGLAQTEERHYLKKLKMSFFFCRKVKLNQDDSCSKSCKNNCDLTETFPASDLRNYFFFLGILIASHELPRS